MELVGFPARSYPVVNGDTLLPPTVVMDILRCTRSRVLDAIESETLTAKGPRRWVTEASVDDLADFIDRSMTISQFAEYLGVSRATANRVVTASQVHVDTRWGKRILRSEARTYRLHRLNTNKELEVTQ